MNKHTENNTVNTVNAVNSNLFAPERCIVDAVSAQRRAVKCTEGNNSRGEARNFKCLEFNGTVFKGEDLGYIEVHYSKFVDCQFEECKLYSMEAPFAEFINCTFKNCDLTNTDFSFAKIANVQFLNCILNSADFPFAQGDITCSNCTMIRFTAPNSVLRLKLDTVNAVSAEANQANLELDITNSNFRRAEFNDSCIKGRISQTNLTNAEFNRSSTELELTDCAVNGLETEEAKDNELDCDLEELFSCDEE